MCVCLFVVDVGWFDSLPVTFLHKFNMIIIVGLCLFVVVVVVLFTVFLCILFIPGACLDAESNGP